MLLKLDLQRFAGEIQDSNIRYFKLNDEIMLNFNPKNDTFRDWQVNFKVYGESTNYTNFRFVTPSDGLMQYHWQLVFIGDEASGYADVVVYDFPTNTWTDEKYKKIQMKYNTYNDDDGDQPISAFDALLAKIAVEYQTDTFTTPISTHIEIKTIKIKLDDLIGCDNFTAYVQFKSNGVTYNKIIGEYDSPNSLYKLYYGSTDNLIYSGYKTGTWANDNNKIIEIVPTQTFYDDFTSGMSENIIGVELKAGTYKWDDSISSPIKNVSTSINFVSNSKNFTSIGIMNVFTGRNLFYSINSDNSYVYNFKSATWVSAVWQTIFVETDQYIDYDFYNYAILGNQLVKQESTPSGTNNLRFGSDTPSKLYMGDTEITKAYMGDTLVYEK